MKLDPMSTTQARDIERTQAQPVAAPLTRAAIFLVVALKPGSENRAVVRLFCGDLAGLVRSGRVSRS